MKLKSLLWTLGIRPKPKAYGHRMCAFDLPKEGTIEYAKWLHPKSYSHECSQSTIDCLRRFISPGDFVIDIGAHAGDFTLPLALAAGAEGETLALEPNPYVFDALKTTANLNRSKTNITPLCCAAAKFEGPIQFHYSDPGYCNGGCLEDISVWKHGHPFELTVPGIKLSQWIAENRPERIEQLSFIKIDAEGYDLQVLESLEDIVKKYRPTLNLEMYRHLPVPERRRLLTRLHGLGYRVNRIDNEDDWQEGPVLNFENLRDVEHYDIFCVHESKSRLLCSDLQPATVGA